MISCNSESEALFFSAGTCYIANFISCWGQKASSSKRLLLKYRVSFFFFYLILFFNLKLVSFFNQHQPEIHISHIF